MNFTFSRSLAVSLGCLVLFACGEPATAAMPSSATITDSATTTITWANTAVGSGAAMGENGPPTPTEGVNSDTFTLTVAPGDYTNKVITVKIQWTAPTDDYDLYVHFGNLTGPLVGTSATGAPGTSEMVTIVPPSHVDDDQTVVYVIRTLYFTNAPGVDQPQGSATLGVNTAPAQRVATYIDGSTLSTPLAFGPNKPVKAPVTNSDGEPSNRTDVEGNFYVGGIRGVPAGVDLWRFNLNPASANYDPLLKNPIYRGQPDAFVTDNGTGAEGGGDGGGDIDLAVGFGPNLSTQSVANPITLPGPPILAFSSLAAANLSTGNSLDRGNPATYNKNPIGNLAGGVGVDDRQWMEFFGSSTCYILYRTIGETIGFIQRSTDGGFTYGPVVTTGASDQTGGLDVDQKDGILRADGTFTDGTVYACFNDGQVAVGLPDATTGYASISNVNNSFGSYRYHQAVTDPNGVAHIFCTVKVANDGTPSTTVGQQGSPGTAYVVYSNERNIFLVSSKDRGNTWSAPVQVNPPAIGTLTNVFPWIETGPTAGSIGVVWYGATDPINDNAANWKVYYAQSFNASSNTPSFTYAKVSDHVIHTSNISEGGLTGAANRNLLDYFQISFDPLGAAVVGYTDDHADYNGNVFVARQITGPSIKGSTLSAPAPYSVAAPAGEAAPPAVPGPNGEQVTDFANDASQALLVRLNQPDPLDILSIKYLAKSLTGGTVPDALQIKMTVSGDLNTSISGSLWEMMFAINAPNSQISDSGDFSYGLPERGDQFYARATLGNDGVPVYTVGRASRASNGSIAYNSTDGGTTTTPTVVAERGTFNPQNGTIKLRVSFAKLNTLLAAGQPPMAPGSILVGLRGRTTGPASSATTSDETYAGTQFTVPATLP